MQNGTILKATDRKAVCAVVAVHVGIAAVEVQVSGVGTIYRTRPVVAVATHIVECAIAVVAVAGYGQ